MNNVQAQNLTNNVQENSLTNIQEHNSSTNIQEQSPPKEIPSISLSRYTQYILKKHLTAYRQVCDKIIERVGSIFVPWSDYAITNSRKFFITNYFQVFTAKAINKIAIKIIQKNVIEDQWLKTENQKKQEQELIELRSYFGLSNGNTKFGEATGNYINERLPRVISDKMQALPGFIGWLALYNAPYSLFWRYAKRQGDMKLQIEDRLSKKHSIRKLNRIYNRLTTTVSHIFFGKEHLETVLNFEWVLLRCLKGIDSLQKNNTNSVGPLGLIIKSLSGSLAYQQEIDKFLKELDCRSDEEKMIARISWHKQNNLLPKGLPDPKVEKLTGSNLQEKLDDCMHNYLKEIVEKIFDKTGISQSLGNHSTGQGILYHLEGKEILINLLAYLIGEYGIKQITDPHRFAMAILYSRGQEVAGYEVDGFGMDSMKTILELGKKIMEGIRNEVTPDNADPYIDPAEADDCCLRNWNTIRERATKILDYLKNKDIRSKAVSMYEDSGLTPNPAGLESILQRQRAKEHLREYVSELIHTLIKNEDTRSEGIFKKVREQLSDFPIIGIPTLTLHFIVNGMYYSLGYLIKNGNDANSYSAWMAQKFSGKKLCDLLADRIVDLIYHPSWHITVLQLINDYLDNLERSVKNPPLSINDFQKVTNFLFQHLTSEFALTTNLLPLFNYFTSESNFDLFKSYTEPSGGDSMLNKVIGSFAPSMKEMMLYSRITDAFRRQDISFEGDAKFWEFFVRGTLNEIVEDRFAKEVSGNLEIKGRWREYFVDLLLELDSVQLCTDWSDVRKRAPEAIERKYGPFVVRDRPPVIPKEKAEIPKEKVEIPKEKAEVPKEKEKQKEKVEKKSSSLILSIRDDYVDKT